MFIDAGDAQLYSLAFGPPAEPAVVCMGGWIGSWEVWAEPIARLSGERRMIGYDHRGSGASVAPLESITFDRLVQDVFTVQSFYGLERCVLAAESAGAAVAIQAALKRPERISALVIVDSAYYRERQEGPDRFLAGLQVDYSRTLDQFAALCTPEPDSELVRRWGRQILGRADQAAAIALYQLLDGVDLRSALGGLRQPVLVLHGDADQIASLEDGRQLAAAAPNARLVVLPGAGHVPTMTCPERVAAEIGAFLLALAD
jgi:pimeloyl-ACP methyl ester carboxylesterase